MRFVVASIVVVSVLGYANHAEAQEGRPGRPYRGLFGSGAGEAEQLLTATGSLGGGWDDNVVADAGGRNVRRTDVNHQFRGGLGTASGALSYVFNRGPATLGASAGTTAGYYPQLSHRIIRRDYGSIRASATFENGFSGDATAAYQPYSLRWLLPSLIAPGFGDSVITDDDFPALTQHYVAYSTGAAFSRAGFSVHGRARHQPYSFRTLSSPLLFEPRPGDPGIADSDPASISNRLAYSAGANYSRRLTRRQTLSATYGYNTRESLHGTGRFEHHTAGAAVTHALGRGLDLHFGYQYSEAQYGELDRGFVNHGINAGVNYNRALSISRRTTLSFGTGSTATRVSRTGTLGSQNEQESVRYRATGAAQLAHEIGRTWNATLSYNRGLQFVDSWPEPLFSNSAAAGLTGLINRRTQLQLTARAADGSGFSRRGRRGRDVENYSTAATLTVAVTRNINTGLTYAYYKHQFADGFSLAAGLPRDLERQSIRGFVSAWVPLFYRARRP